MYGYVRTHAPELKVREQEYYRAVYCGLCRTMGKCTGQCSRMTLSYDVTLLALVRLALEGRDVTITSRRCAIHPLRKKPMADPDETLAYCARASALLIYHKTLDDRADERGGRRMRAFLATPYVKALRRKAIKGVGTELDAAVSEIMQRLSGLEAERIPSADRPAELFGELMAHLVSYGLQGDTARIGRELGRRLGRWIYLVDAIDDYEEDKSRGRYNPFLCLWQGGDMTEARREDLSRALMSELYAIEAALDLCDPGDTEQSNLWGTLRNILYLGMPAAAHRVLYPDCTCHQGDHKTKGKVK